MTVFMQMPCHSQWQIKRSSLQPPAVSLPQCIDCCHILMTPKHQPPLPQICLIELRVECLASVSSILRLCAQKSYSIWVFWWREGCFFSVHRKSRASGPTLTASCLWEPPSFGLVFCLWGVYCQRVRPFMSPSIQGEPASALLWIYFLW